MTAICPITYAPLMADETKYSRKGLHLISRNLKDLKDFPYSFEEQLEQARLLATKLSIQGVQPKLSIIIDPKQQLFMVTERGGTYILKPQSLMWTHLPENEDLSMRLAASVGIDTPLHGLVYCKDGTLSYWIRRFDRPSQKSPLTKKLSVEDFAQLSGANRQTKYQSSMEKVAAIIEKFTSFPQIEKEKLFVLTLFNYLIGNEDMHLKNFSLISRDNIVSLSPAYDLLNTTLALGSQVKEEMALPLNAKKNKLTAYDIIEYFGQERLNIPMRRIDKILMTFSEKKQSWYDLIEKSFLPAPLKQRYRALVESRWSTLTKGSRFKSEI